MPEEVKIPLYLNRDDAPEKLSQVEAFDLHNTRPTGTGESEQGYLTNIESTELITNPSDLGTGINLTLGAQGFKNIKKAYALKYNSTGNHVISELDYETLIEEIIFTDLEDTGGEQVFDLSPEHEFTDLKLLHDEYLITADGQSGIVYCINIERLKNGGYGSVITQDAFNLLKQQTLKPIKAEYVDDPNKKSNLLKGKLFQFRAQVGFADYMTSAWSTISKRPIPEMETTDTVGDDPSKLNAIKLTVDIGGELNTSLRIASRAGLYDWYIIKDITRQYILSLPNTEIDIENEIYEAYNPTDNTYTFLFYNDGQGEPIAVSDTDEYYDNIPQNVGAIEIVNGDIVVLGDIEEGYDRPTGLKVAVSVTSYKPQLDISLEEEVRDFTMSGVQFRISGSHRRYVTLFVNGHAKEDDVIKINIGNIDSSTITETFTHIVTAANEASMTSLIDSIYAIVPSISDGGYTKTKRVNSETSGAVTFVTASYTELKSVVLDLSLSGSEVEGKTLNILKSNSSYQLALAHYDKFGRPFPLVTNETAFVAPTSSYAETEGLVPQIGWEITEGVVPEGAVSYQWLLTENTKYLNNLFATAIYDADESEDDFTVFNLASLARYARDGENGIVAYEYSEGDRVTFIHNFDGSSEPVKWFNNPPLDFAIAGFEIKVDTTVDPNTVQYLLKIKKSSLLPLLDLTDKEVLLELYTPKNNNLNINSKIFYEIGEQFDIIDGEYSVRAGVIRTGDAYIKPRKYLSNVESSNDVFVFPVEDFNFSDDYESKFWSAGRGRTYNDEVGKVRRKASFRYSGEYNIGSLNNKINRFYASRIYGDRPEETSSIYGAITKMVMRQTYLIVLQETDVAHIPVFSSIIEDQAEQANLAISSKLFNNARYVGNGLGTGLAKKAICISNNGTVYFIDPNNGYPCRDGFDGVKIINTKMSKFFMDKLKEVNPKSLISTFDDFNNEWNVSFTGLYKQVVVIPFNPQNWEYRDSYELTVEDVMIIPPTNGTAEVDEDGNILYTPDDGYVGTDTVGITFTSGSTVINKNACITINPEGEQLPPVAVNDFFTTAKNTVLNVGNVMTNDTGIGITVVPETKATPHGNIQLFSNGTFIYTPTTNYVGTDIFPYTIIDNISQTASANITMTVTTVVMPVAMPNSYINLVNETLNQTGLMLNDTGTPPLSCVPETKATTFGTVQIFADGHFVYTPEEDFTGLDTFTYTLKDGNNNTASATVTIETYIDEGNAVAVDDYFVSVKNAAKTGSLIANDSGSGILKCVTELKPTTNGGLIQISGNGTFSFLPATNFIGNCAFIYTLMDVTGSTDTATCTINVVESGGAAIAVDDEFEVLANEVLTGNVLLNDSGTGTLTCTPETKATPHGDVIIYSNGNIVYTPDGGFWGTDSFTYTMQDSTSSSDSATVTIEVKLPSIAAVDDYFGTPKNTVLNVGNLMDNDLGIGKFLTAETKATTHGNVQIFTDGTFEYTPDFDYVGVDSFTYTLRDYVFQSATATAFIDVGVYIPAGLAFVGDDTETSCQKTTGGFTIYTTNTNGLLDLGDTVYVYIDGVYQEYTLPYANPILSYYVDTTRKWIRLNSSSVINLKGECDLAYFLVTDEYAYDPTGYPSGGSVCSIPIASNTPLYITYPFGIATGYVLYYISGGIYTPHAQGSIAYFDGVITRRLIIDGSGVIVDKDGVC